MHNVEKTPSVGGMGTQISFPMVVRTILRVHEVAHADLDDIFETSGYVFIKALITRKNPKLFGAKEFAMTRDGTAFILLSRSGFRCTVGHRLKRSHFGNQ